MKKLATLLGLVAALAACATVTPYKPVDKEGFGYFEQKLEANRYRVTFTGNSKTPRQTVEDYVLYRAAELTLANELDYFVLSDRTTNAEKRENGGVHVGVGGFSFGSHSGVSLGLGTFTGSDKTAYQGTVEIQMRKGRKPADSPEAFDAHEVVENLGSSINRGAP